MASHRLMGIGRAGRISKYFTFSVVSLILLTSMIAVNMPQQAIATDTSISFVDNGNDTFTITITSNEGIDTILIVTAKRGTLVGEGSRDCSVAPFQQTFPLTREGITVTVVDCSTPPITTIDTFGGGTGGGGGGSHGSEKVTICHKDKTISVSANAVDNHLAHGDSLGPCP